LVIVESPTKARTISRFLGEGYVVMASNGHIRDLPNRAGEIPAKYKKVPWRDLGVDVENDFEPLYVIPDAKKQFVRDLKAAVKAASHIYLATDEDREGESISWHLVEALNPKVPIERLVFHEITAEAIQYAIDNPREINTDLVEAQETRRIVDRLFGYRVSPLLWKKMAPRLSAGRVQSVAVRLLAERERDRIRFHKAAFWGMKGVFAKNAEAFEADLTHVDGKRVAIGKDFDPDTGLLRERSEAIVLEAERAKRLGEEVGAAAAKAASVEEKPYTASPPPPFVTSTLQQDANRKLRLAARRTMSVAQQLYENGFITYMRTDSTTLSDEALRGARSYISETFGADYLPAEPRQYRTKVRNAQEAHEAIRPAGEDFAAPEQVERQLGPEARKLYEMIWRRAIASQMPDARGTNITVAVEAGPARFRATGKTVEFPGYLQAYAAEGQGAEAAGGEKLLPKMAEGEALATRSVEPLERSTQPPARYTEGSLIRELERLGIGRPSTWATIVELVLSRSYAFKKGTALVPTFTALAVTGLLEEHFTHLCDYAFTARLEDDLDAISRGEAGRVDYLRRFYFGNGHAGLQALIEQGEGQIDPRQACGLPLGQTEDGRDVEVRIGRYGPFLSVGEQRASVPDETPPDELSIVAALELIEAASKEPESLGNDPDTGEPVILKNGRYGPYVQLGTGGEGKEKPKMASLLPGMAPESVDLKLALELLALPRTIAAHPDSGEPVLAANGRFGPYVKSGDEIRSIPAGEMSPLTITIEQAVELLKQPKGRRRAAAPSVLHEVGKHPLSEKDLKVLSGRYGPYVTDGEVNASLPRGLAPGDLKIEQAVDLLDARAARIAANPPGTGRKKVARKKASKKSVKKTARKTAKRSVKKVAKEPS